MPVSQGQAGVHQEMRKFKEGTLHSGSKTGPIVTNRKQAIAIAMKESGQSRNVSFTSSGQRKKKQSFRKGGVVPSAGSYKLHGGELVIPHHMTAKIGQMMRNYMMAGAFKRQGGISNGKS